MERLEGNGPARFISLMKRYGYNRGFDVNLAKVEKVNPFEIRFHGDPFTLSGDEIIVSRTVNDYIRNDRIKIGEHVIVMVTESDQLYYVIDVAN